MTIIAATTTCISISPSQPATYDIAGYDGIADWAVYDNFREVSDLVETRTSTKVINMCTGKYDIITGAIQVDDMTVTLGFDPQDQAQLDSDAQFEANVQVSVREVDSVGNIFYSKATILSRSRGRIDGDEVKRAYTFGISDLIVKLV